MKALAVFLAALAAASSSPHALAPRVNPRDALRYRWIPAGSYVTGCLPDDKQCYGLERRRLAVA